MSSSVQPPADGGHARRLASGSLAQQASQVAGLLAMLAIVTVLARRLPLAEFGLFGLLSSLAGYLLVVQNAAAGAAVRQMSAGEPEQRARAFSTAVALYVAAGLVAGVAVAAMGVALAGALDLPASARSDGRLGAALLGAVTALGWPLTVVRDGLRARQLFVRLAAAEVLAVAAYAGLVLGLAFGDAGLAALIGASGALPALAGAFAWLVGRGAPRPLRWRREAVSGDEARLILGLGGYLSLTEAAATAVYTIDRVILGALKSAATVGLYEGPVRAHNLLRALNAAVTTTVLPAASRFVSEHDAARLRELLVRGLRYSLALVVPLTVTGMVLAGPILEVWLGSGFREGADAMAILLVYWLAYGASGVVSATLVAVGRARDVARCAVGATAANVVLALALVPPLGLEGVAIATSVPYLVVSGLLLRFVLEAVPVDPGSFLRETFLPAWVLGACLAAALGVLRALVELDSLGLVAVVGALAPVSYWAAFYFIWLRPSERQLVREVAGSAFPAGRA
jgi:PST family polysaccharide transporter